MRTASLRDSVSPALYMMISIILAGMVGTFSFTLYNTYSQYGNEIVSQSIEDENRLLESVYMQYDGAVVTGVQINDLIRNCYGEYIFIGDGNSYVACDGSASGPTGTNISVSEWEPTPNKKYTGEVLRNDNGIYAIRFAAE